ncbi:MAG: hypothetical protein KAG06_02965 [Methylococcales bacterium]|nr:hypothetical protein [Methylococcales bacterium]
MLLFYTPFIFAGNCAVYAYVTDPDPAGLNVRASPKGKILGIIPTHDASGVTVKIVDAKQGWMKIQEIEILDAGTEFDMPSNGWVHGSMLTVDFRIQQGDRDISLYQAPVNTPKKIQIFHTDKNEPLPKITNILDCRSGWLKVTVKKAKKAIKGWLAAKNQCSNPLTTCS